MKIAIDFDGVLAKHKGIPTIPEGVLDLEPMEGAVDAVKYLISLKYDIYVFTSNKNQYEIEVWLGLNGFPKLEVTNLKKEHTHLFIDDRSIRFTNWNDIRKYIG
jgi:hypothetical protein